MQEIFSKIAKSRGFYDDTIIKNWDKIAMEYSEKYFPVSLKTSGQGVILYVLCTNRMASVELPYAKEDLIKRINAWTKAQITDIRTST